MSWGEVCGRWGETALSAFHVSTDEYPCDTGTNKKMGCLLGLVLRLRLSRPEPARSLVMSTQQPDRAGRSATDPGLDPGEEQA